VEKDVRDLEIDVCSRLVAEVGKMVKQVRLVHRANTVRLCMMTCQKVLRTSAENN
jgi:hypothetical protein